MKTLKSRRPESSKAPPGPRVPEHTWAPGTLIRDRYRVIRIIGEGGMGQVYEAERVDLPFPRRFAIKAISREHCRRADLRRRFEEEARLMAKLVENEHMVEILDLGTDDEGRIYLVMELLKGRTLYTELRLRQRQPEIDPPYVRWALGIGVQVLSALEAAHAIGAVHRDVKPENVFLQTNGVVKLLDFGIAKLLQADAPRVPGERVDADNTTAPGTFLGTPRYAAPECIQKKGVDARSDVFSVGVLLWELLAKTHPLPQADQVATCVNMVLHGIPGLDSRLGLKLPDEVCAVVRRATLSAPQDRFPTAREFIEAIEEAMKALPEGQAPWLLPASDAEIAAIQHGWSLASSIDPLGETSPNARGSSGETAPERPAGAREPASFPYPLEGDPTHATSRRELPTRTSEYALPPRLLATPTQTTAEHSITVAPSPENADVPARRAGGLLRRSALPRATLALACSVVAIGAAGAWVVTRGANARAGRDVSSPLSVERPSADLLAPSVPQVATALANATTPVPVSAASSPAEPPPVAAPTPEPVAPVTEITGAPSASIAPETAPSAVAAREAKPVKKRPKPAAEAPPLPVRRLIPIEMGSKK
jgi:serine/threonine protein kinase